MPRWRVALAERANSDFVDILEHTIETFGARQARIYRSTLTSALRALESGPELRGSKPRDEVAAGLRSLHVARSGRRGRHVIVYRAGPKARSRSCASCMMRWIWRGIWRQKRDQTVPFLKTRSFVRSSRCGAFRARLPTQQADLSHLSAQCLRTYSTQVLGGYRWRKRGQSAFLPIHILCPSHHR